MSPLVRAKSLLFFLVDKVPVTLRGMIFVASGAWSLSSIALPEGDLVLSVLGGGALGLPLMMTTGTLILGRKLRRSLRATSAVEGGMVFSRAALHSGLTVRNGTISPLFELQLQRAFQKEGVVSPSHVLTGTDLGERSLTDTLRFPHRGIWRLTKLKCTVRDRFGFSRFNFSIPLEQEIEIFAPPFLIRPLPIVAASARAGDLIEHHKERTGDPFDIKPYDPSDGVSRILWKTYAKSGQLVVRRPEPSVIPDGEVAVYLVASPNEDHVAGAFASYFEQLTEANVAILFSTDGSGGTILRNEREIFRAIHEGVWHENVGTGNDLPHFLDALLESGRLLSQIVVFCDTSTCAEWLPRASVAAASRNIRLTLATVPASHPAMGTKPHISPNLTALQPNPFLEVLACERSEQIL